MTPEEKSVTRDWMLERGHSEEEIERALNPKFVVRLCMEPETAPKKIGWLSFSQYLPGLRFVGKRELATTFQTYDEAFAMLEHYQGRNSPYGSASAFEYRPEEGWVEQL